MNGVKHLSIKPKNMRTEYYKGVSNLGTTSMVKLTEKGGMLIFDDMIDIIHCDENDENDFSNKVDVFSTNREVITKKEFDAFYIETVRNINEISKL